MPTPSIHDFTQSCSCCGNPGHSLGRKSSSRRRFITSSVAGMVALSAGSALAPRAFAQSAMTPDEALKELLDGNKRFIQKQLTSCSDDLTILQQNTISKQEPFAAVLSCADSRVPVELVFDQSIGHLFVTRVAGNLATSEIIASLEYGAAVLGTKTILVLGHSGCGAVKAALSGKEVPGEISGLFAMIQPAVAASGGNLETAIKDNAKFQADLIAKSSPLLAGMIRTGNLSVEAGYYALDTGQVTMLNA